MKMPKMPMGSTELLILHDVFDIPTDILEHKLLTMLLWGRPHYGKDLALYWAWQAIMRLKKGGEPVSSYNLRMVFIANLLKVEVEEIVTEKYHFLLEPVRETITRYLDSLMEPEIVPARFQPMDWAWHMKDWCPVLILGWDEDYCKFLQPIRDKKKLYSISIAVGEGPLDEPYNIGAIQCVLVELDHEPKYLIPLHLEMKKREPESDRGEWPGWEEPHGMDVQF